MNKILHIYIILYQLALKPIFLFINYLFVYFRKYTVKEGEELLLPYNKTILESFFHAYQSNLLTPYLKSETLEEIDKLNQQTEYSSVLSQISGAEFPSK